MTSDPLAADAQSNGTEAILRVDGVTKQFGGMLAVDRASFDVQPGSITALIGPNGAGKTTLFNVLTGFIRGDSGDVTYEGESIVRKPPHAIARRRMVRTFQITKALSAMSVMDNMLLAAPDHPGERLHGLLLHPRASRRRERESRERARELLARFALAERAHEYAGTLSGGQRKLLELARALMVQPRLMLLDEPMAGINPTLGHQLLEHMCDLRERTGMTFLFIEHDMDAVMSYSDQVIVMAQGYVIASGLPDEVRSDQRVIDAYLGTP